MSSPILEFLSFLMVAAMEKEKIETKKSSHYYHSNQQPFSPAALTTTLENRLFYEVVGEYGGDVFVSSWEKNQHGRVIIDAVIAATGLTETTFELFYKGKQIVKETSLRYVSSFFSLPYYLLLCLI